MYLYKDNQIDVIETNRVPLRTFPCIQSDRHQLHGVVVDALFEDEISEVDIQDLPLTAIKAPQSHIARLTMLTEQSEWRWPQRV